MLDALALHNNNKDNMKSLKISALMLALVAASASGQTTTVNTTSAGVGSVNISNAITGSFNLSGSGAVSSSVIGIAIGKTYVDENCKTLKNARELWNMGQRAAALARMCMDDQNREAMEATGFVCPERKKEAK